MQNIPMTYTYLEETHYYMGSSVSPQPSFYKNRSSNNRKKGEERKFHEYIDMPYLFNAFMKE